MLGSLGDIETGIRQLRRSRPLEVETIDVDGRMLTVPTAVETLRVKAWLALTRNQTRDYLDIAALTAVIGVDRAAQALGSIDDYYGDINPGDDRVVTQLVRQLADPRPRDHRVTRELDHYRRLDPHWHDWAVVREATASLAQHIVELGR